MDLRMIYIGHWQYLDLRSLGRVGVSSFIIPEILQLLLKLENVTLDLVLSPGSDLLVDLFLDHC